MELAIINGTYRDGSKLQQKVNQLLLPPGSAALVGSNQGLRSPPNPLGQPLIISPRHHLTSANGGGGGNSSASQQMQAMMNGAAQNGHQLITSTDPTSGGLIYTTIPTSLYSDHLNAAAAQFLEYPNGIDFSQAGAIKQQRFTNAGAAAAAAALRAHPYARVALS
jgi:hypothetical protein